MHLMGISSILHGEALAIVAIGGVIQLVEFEVQQLINLLISLGSDIHSLAPLPQSAQ